MDLDTQFEPYVHRLYKVFKTVCEMLSDRVRKKERKDSTLLGKS